VRVWLRAGKPQPRRHQRRKIMKAAFVLIVFLAATALAQDRKAVAAAEAACGPQSVNFSVDQNTTDHPVPQPDSGKAIIYIVQDDEEHIGSALIKIGMDGAWMGANRGASYLFFPAETGEHHLCVNWQSRVDWRSHFFGMANFIAEPDHVYYFREHILESRAGIYFDFDQINSDQGKYLVALSAHSISHPKK
jgi:hypothetical protein